LSHLRKFGCDLTYISQHQDRVAKTLRDLTNEVQVWKAYYFGRPIFRGTTWEPERVQRKGGQTGGEWSRFSPWVGACYSSLYCSAYGAQLDPSEVAVVEALASARNAGRGLSGVVVQARASVPVEPRRSARGR